jgi:hypothetical protein
MSVWLLDCLSPQQLLLRFLLLWLLVPSQAWLKSSGRCPSAGLFTATTIKSHGSAAQGRPETHQQKRLDARLALAAGP